MKPATNDRSLLAALVALTAVTGLVDAVSFLGLGRIFTANMTGNIVLLGFAFAGVQELSVSRSSAALVSFAAGSVAGARLVPKDRSPGEQLSVAMLYEVALLALAALVAVGAAGELSGMAAYVVIACTAVAMGLRTAVVRRMAVPDVTTTVLTLTLAGLAADSVIGGGHALRTRRRVLSIVAMIAGAFVGAALLQRFSVAVPLGGAALLVAALAVSLRYART